MAAAHRLDTLHRCCGSHARRAWTRSCARTVPAYSSKLLQPAYDATDTCKARLLQLAMVGW